MAPNIKKKTPSASVDDYLKAIWELTAADEHPVTSSRLADRLRVQPPSVTGMLQKLAVQKPPLVLYKKHHGVHLTERGKRRALEIVRHHRLIESFLYDILNYNWDEIHEEAERLEHFISERFEDRIAAKLGDPEWDPHGHMIPRKDGTLLLRNEIPLLQIASGTKAVVSSLSDRDGERLRYLRGLGIVPGKDVTVIERLPFDGPVLLRVGEQTDKLALSPSLAKQVFVIPQKPEAAESVSHDAPREPRRGNQS